MYVRSTLKIFFEFALILPHFAFILDPVRGPRPGRGPRPVRGPYPGRGRAVQWGYQHCNAASLELVWGLTLGGVRA